MVAEDVAEAEEDEEEPMIHCGAMGVFFWQSLFCGEPLNRFFGLGVTSGRKFNIYFLSM